MLDLHISSYQLLFYINVCQLSSCLSHKLNIDLQVEVHLAFGCVLDLDLGPQDGDLSVAKLDLSVFFVPAGRHSCCFRPGSTSQFPENVSSACSLPLC